MEDLLTHFEAEQFAQEGPTDICLPGLDGHQPWPQTAVALPPTRGCVQFDHERMLASLSNGEGEV